MRALRYATLAAAIVRRNLFDSALGYPRAASSRGAMVPAGLGITFRCAAIRPHPTLPRFALQESDEMQALEGGAVDIGAGIREVLVDSEWFPQGSTPDEV